MVVLEPAKKSGESRALRGAMKSNGKPPELTTPDLVLLSLLAERPMYGHQAHRELKRRCVQDWAAISRPQRRLRRKSDPAVYLH